MAWCVMREKGGMARHQKGYQEDRENKSAVGGMKVIRTVVSKVRRHGALPCISKSTIVLETNI